MPPPLKRLSRPVTRKFIVRVVTGSDSPKVGNPFKISLTRGNVRDGLETAAKDRNIGRLPSSVLGGEAAPRSNSSQQKERSSPSASLPSAPSVKGVPCGIV